MYAVYHFPCNAGIKSAGFSGENVSDGVSVTAVSDASQTSGDSGGKIGTSKRNLACSKVIKIIFSTLALNNRSK